MIPTGLAVQVHQVKCEYRHRDFDFFELDVAACSVGQLLERFQAAVDRVYGYNLRVQNERLGFLRPGEYVLDK